MLMDIVVVLWVMDWVACISIIDAYPDPGAQRETEGGGPEA